MQLRLPALPAVQIIDNFKYAMGNKTHKVHNYAPSETRSLGGRCLHASLPWQPRPTDASPLACSGWVRAVPVVPGNEGHRAGHPRVGSGAKESPALQIMIAPRCHAIAELDLSQVC